MYEAGNGLWLGLVTFDQGLTVVCGRCIEKHSQKHWGINRWKRCLGFALKPPSAVGGGGAGHTGEGSELVLLNLGDGDVGVHYTLLSTPIHL